MNCPACKKNNMIVVEYKGVELDNCVDCGGVWFDMDELELLFGALEPGIELPHIADASTENKISFARQFYNDSVMRFNTKIQSVPSNIIAGMFGFKEEKMFEIEDRAEKDVPEVKYN